jgi:hypothetical protein
MDTSYAERLEAVIRARATRFTAAIRPGRFGILTTVYVKTDAALFRETAACLFAQTTPFDSWVILAHGPIPADLEETLQELQGDPRVRILRREVNLGIMGGMQLCLAEADTDYVVPMDADDLLTSDALQVLSAEIDRLGAPAFLYSDEDLLIDGQPQAPYLRPDWDPVLNLVSSYIWHLCCLRRDAALEAGLYTDAGATWCHDWDTAFRLSRRELPAHVPEVLYHWRQHPASSTNTSDGPNEGSRQSTRHLLQRFISALPNPDLYHVGETPIFRGAPEWHVFRRAELSPPVLEIVIEDGTSMPPGSTPATRRLRLPARRSWLKRLLDPAARAGATVGELQQALSSASEPYVLLLGEGVRPVGEQWWWEAVKLFECHPEVAVVTGLLTDGSGKVLRGLEVLDEGGRLVQPQLGQPVEAGGPWVLWLKAQCVDAACTDFCFVETRLLREVLEALPANTTISGLGLRLAAHAARLGRLCAWSPMVRAVAHGRATDGPAETVPALAESVLDTIPVVWASGRRSRLAHYG